MALPAFAFNKETKVLVYAHLWVYASRHSPDWDCTPILDDLFSDLKYSGLEGVTDFRAIAKALKEINYAGKAAIELAFDEPPKNSVREDWTNSREYVRKVFGW